ncbi:DUF3667 domain-containing protein [Algoriphagus litoralis]|uniref:DUF3667 domain-containing protein n=1 Tax=Algoriphagus litoralis TaxID=2202829 RepID=UPI000DB963CF|nr:DUF3667 domain-containing protein [Algoriphagus litoralis]
MAREPLKIWETGEAIITKEKKIRRFTFRNLIQSFLDIFELDRGIVYTVIGLFQYPGRIIRGYLDTERLTITNPIRYFLFIVGLSTYLTVKFDFWIQQNLAFGNSETANMSVEQQEFNQRYIEVYQSVFVDYLSIWFAVSALFTAFFSYLFFRKSGFTYWEQLIGNLFIFNQMTLMFIPFILISSVLEVDSLYLVYILASYTYAIWAYKDLFTTGWGAAIFKGLLIQTLGTVLFFALFAVVLTVVLLW